MIEESGEKKINEFSEAMYRYQQYGYKKLEVVVSFLIIILQALTIINLVTTYQNMPLFIVFLILISAYIATDFINGLIHMYMDNNTNYTSLVGPFIAAFHLHHFNYRYQTRRLIKVYFDESGTKFWLLVYLLILFSLQSKLSTPCNLALVAFGIFSSLAELSHYWCHNATAANKIITWLQKNYILLNKTYHKTHHASDNIQYAFLNGMTDPLINLIARHYARGYKNYADQHTKAYMRKSL